MTHFKPCTAEDRAPILAYRTTDDTFLRVHPATAAWWRRRDKCRDCAHYLPDVPSPETRTNTGERCGAIWLHIGGSGHGRTVRPYCIDARQPGAKCGPGAALFTARSEK